MTLIWDTETEEEKAENLRKGQTAWFIQNAFEVFTVLPPDETSRKKFENLPRKKQIKLLARLIRHLEDSKDEKEKAVSRIAVLTWQSLRGSAPPQIS